MKSYITKEKKRELENLYSLNSSLGFPKLYIVGGAVRNYFLNLGKESIVDIDITNNDGFKSGFLGLCYAYKNNLKIKYITSARKNNRVKVLNTDFDFSSGWVSKHSKFDTKIEREVGSRDFTVNSILYDYQNENFVDVTGRGIKDCLGKKLSTILKPKFTFSDDPTRIFRGLYFASKYNLEIDSEIMDFLLKEKDFVKEQIKQNRNFVINKVAESLKENEEKTMAFLINADIYKDVPLVGEYKNILIKNKLISDYYDNSQEDFAIDPIAGLSGNSSPRIFYGVTNQELPHYGDNSIMDDNNYNNISTMPHLS